MYINLWNMSGKLGEDIYQREAGLFVSRGVTLSIHVSYLRSTSATRSFSTALRSAMKSLESHFGDPCCVHGQLGKWKTLYDWSIVSTGLCSTLQWFIYWCASKKTLECKYYIGYIILKLNKYVYIYASCIRSALLCNINQFTAINSGYINLGRLEVFWYFLRSKLLAISQASVRD